MSAPLAREELRPLLRDERPPSDAVVVVRGGPSSVDRLREHARRTYDAYVLDGQPLWGVSVFCALDDVGTASIDTLLRRFASYRVVHFPTVGQLVAAHFDLLPSFRPAALHRPTRGRRRSQPHAPARCPRTARSEPVPWTAAARKELAVVSVDITCDLMDEDESGYVWTFLREARDPSLIVPGAIVIAGDPDASAVAEVVEVVDKPAGPVVHLRVLPGAIEDYEALVRRAITPA